MHEALMPNIFFIFQISPQEKRTTDHLQIHSKTFLIFYFVYCSQYIFSILEHFFELLSANFTQCSSMRSINTKSVHFIVLNDCAIKLGLRVSDHHHQCQNEGQVPLQDENRTSRLTTHRRNPPQR